MHRKTSGVFVGMLGVLCGCATIAPKPPTMKDEPVRADPVEVIRAAGAHATMALQGTNLDLTAVHYCDLVEHPVVYRTVTTEHENASAWKDWSIGGAGIALVGGGAYTVIDARNVASKSTASKNYNPVGSGGATAIGIAEIAVGVGLGAVAIYDVIRANRIDVETKKAQLDTRTIKERIVCSSAPLAYAPVVGEIGEHAYNLGATDDAGKLRVDLDPVMREVLAKDAHLKVKVATVDVGDLDLSPVYLAHEKRGWTNSLANECRNPSSESSCRTLAMFSTEYPDGPHAGEARTILEQSKPAIMKFADASAWSRLDIEACTKRPFDDPNEIDRACGDVKMYLLLFPSGAHARDAEAAIKAGEARATALRTKINQALKVEARKDEQAQKAEEAKEAAVERRQCHAQCQVACSSWWVRDFRLCYTGCIQLPCGQ
jgi:hypothetical protein